MLRRFAFPAVFLFLSISLFAQTSPPPVRVQGDTIVVTADRIAEPLGDTTDSVTVITAAQLQEAQIATVAEALRDVAGVSIVRSGSPGHTTSAFLRGASPSQLLLLIDGVEVNDPFFGGVDIGALVTSGVERIEVVRGAQSPLYGSQAMAGVINVVTAPRDSSQSGIDGTLRVEGGSMRTHDEALQLAGANWKFDLSHLATAGQFENDEFRNFQLGGRMSWDVAPGSMLALHARAGDSHIGIPFDGTTPRADRESDSQLILGGLDYQLQASSRNQLELRGSLTRREDSFRDPDDRYSQSSSHDSTLLRGLAQDTVSLESLTLTFGIEQKHEDVFATSDGATALDESIRTTAIYAQDKFERGALLLTLGARWDQHSRFGGHTSPRVSAAYRFAEHWRMRAAAGRAFRAPSTGELAYPFYGNPDLDPETSSSYEAGFDFTTADRSFSLTGFDSSYRGLITFDPNTFIAANIDRATIRGVEVAGGVRMGGGWRVDASYTHLSTRDEGTGNPLYRRPRNSGSATLSYAREAWSGSANVNAIGKRFERDFATSTDRINGGWVKVDVAAAYRFRPTLRFTARVENLFDREYQEALAFSAPGRTFHAGIQLGF